MAAAPTNERVFYRFDRIYIDLYDEDREVRIAGRAIIPEEDLQHHIAELFGMLKTRYPQEPCSQGLSVPECQQDPLAHIRLHEETDGNIHCHPSPYVTLSEDGMEIAVKTPSVRRIYKVVRLWMATQEDYE
uniref:Uncharacterized protein n=1 Tax=viral metagenome TaxID=1070528 RepID=A0A6C0JZB2_9ZZZZ